ncbi:glycosyl transferase [Aestuariivirga litoralis]|uniref:O-linked N-acetylglucosamine transferase, SPINDLY family protein n=1 Tax=Aestuariivirga litoralis TaxID=2650924 RepID=UPI0018C672B3|nr:glycosyl transferase [Aestuariivirga litoralis]MBG1232604.1 glycosyl transferase [Aestuariivirga litoralis]
MTQISIVELFKAAESLEKGGDGAGAVNLYKNWVAFNADNPHLHAAMFNYAVVMARHGDSAGAINVMRDCIRLKPDFLPPYINLGRLLEDCGQAGSAISQWLELSKKLPEVTGENIRHKLMAQQQAGRVLEGNHLDVPAEDVLRQSIDIKPDQPEVVQHWIALRQKQCKWPVMEAWEGVTTRDLLKHISPLSTSVMYDDAVMQLGRAYSYAKTLVKRPPQSFGKFEDRMQPRAEKLRIGYVSSDLREHAVGFGMSEALELHDRERYEIHAFYCGIAHDDATKQRIKNSVDSWTNITGMSDDDAAALIHAAKIDILIDLNGYTRDARTAVFARRPAPVQVNWYGFPGSMATPYHHYLIADEVTIPRESEAYFTEKVLRIPVYQPNDRKRKISAEMPKRADENLPEQGFVFCCLNGTQKITEPLFTAWMEILRNVPGSVLWLLDSVAETHARLKAIATKLGVDENRLCFAPKRPNPLHLARYQLADLFLDTFPYGAHTTSSDAMWVGTPVLTMPGQSFASRVCASLVRAAGTPELIVPDLATYIATATRLGLNPSEVQDFKVRLRASRDLCVLFDTNLLVSSLESLYDQMWEDFASGNLPQPDLRNLDIYEDIALAHQAQSGPVDAPSYQAALAAWNDFYPLQLDSRLWTGETTPDSNPLASAAKGDSAPAAPLEQRRVA